MIDREERGAVEIVTRNRPGRRSAVDDERPARHLRAALSALHDAPVVTIAAVHGAALGAGMQLAVACDLRVVAPDARFGIPAARLGLMVDQWTGHELALNALEPVVEDPAAAAAFRRAWASDDQRERRAAFAEKRPPRFEGR